MEKRVDSNDVAVLQPPPYESVACNPSEVISIEPSPPPVRDHFIWSLFSLTNFNVLCLGLLAVVYSVKSRDQKLIGNTTAARHYGKTAKQLNIGAMIGSLIVLAFLIYKMCYDPHFRKFF
ncbi:dispanin subfamily A member 2b-like [Protopterus annectens]|uniref:dispanin subfamily A member 2b-like n=1 Tax=Protopterus annectens TaxID=7888 RepID=UPI001CFBF0BB|nr:dispanin subfamily A member 2b-like [Protopterus annectens]